MSANRFDDAVDAVTASGGLSAEFMLGYRRGLQRVLYGRGTVADAEHDAWLSLSRIGCRWPDRVNGYLAGAAALDET